MYASSNSIDVRALLPRGTSGFILWFDEGDVAGRKADCYPITVGSAAKNRDLEEPARLIIYGRRHPDPNRELHHPSLMAPKSIKRGNLTLYPNYRLGEQLRRTARVR